LGATEFEEVRAVAKAHRENVAGLLALTWPKVEAEVRTLTTERFAQLAQQTKLLAKIRLPRPGPLSFAVRLLAWRFDRAPSAVLQVEWALSKPLRLERVS
jgi:hypothetical protein